MAFCSQCGFQNPDDAKFCSSCGADLAQENIPDAGVPTPTPPVTPPPSTPPVTPTPVPPPAQPMAAAYQAPPSAAPYQAAPYQAAPPQKSGSGMGKTCLGCGCAFLVVLLIILGVGGWWVYKYMQEHNADIDEMLEMIDKGTAQYQEAQKATYKGQLVKELAEEKGLPFVTIDERPKEGPVYLSEDEDVAVRFNYMAFKDGESIGTMIFSGTSGGQELIFKIAPCGCSIYHATSPSDPSMEAYVFVPEGAKRVLISADGEVRAFTMAEYKDDF